jgi:cellulose synthase (UDP-forming)
LSVSTPQTALDSLRPGTLLPAERSELLPQPPEDTEKHSYVKRHLWVLILSSLISFGCIVVSQFRFAQANPWLWIYVPLLAFTVLYYLVSLRVNAISRDFDLRRHQDLVRSWKPAEYPTVDILLPVCGEPVQVLHNTWTHARAMMRHYPGVTNGYVLDDSASPALAAMAADFGFSYGSRPNRGWYKKAGNIHYGLGRSNGQYILILDADFAPRVDLLNEMLPYMETDPKIGIVQSPQYFRVLDSQNWIERGAGAVQELFYRSVQVSRQAHDGAICVGTCAIYRRAALDSNGGTTLIEHSEDVHTGFDLRRLGWDLRYLPIVLSAGVCPDTGNAFFKQQYRWCAGSMSLLRSKKFWSTRLRLTSRLCYLSGFFYYIHTALFTFVAPLIPITLLLAMPDLLRLENMVLLLPSIIYNTIIFPMWHRCPYRLEAWTIRMLYGWAHVFAIWDILRGRQAGWQPTGSATARRGDTRRVWIGVAAWSGGTAVVWTAAAFWRMATGYPPDFALVLASGLFYTMIVGRGLIQPRSGHS